MHKRSVGATRFGVKLWCAPQSLVSKAMTYLSSMPKKNINVVIMTDGRTISAATRHEYSTAINMTRREANAPRRAGSAAAQKPVGKLSRWWPGSRTARKTAIIIARASGYSYCRAQALVIEGNANLATRQTSILNEIIAARRRGSSKVARSLRLTRLPRGGTGLARCFTPS